MGSSNCLTASHGIVEVTAERVSETKEYRNYIESSEFETKNIFEQKSIQLTRQYLNQQDLTLQDENIPLTRLNENITMT